MARKKSSKKSAAKRSAQTYEMIDSKTEDLLPTPNMSSWSQKPAPMIGFKHIMLVILIVGLVVLFVSNKGMLLAATVNGRPVFRWDLNKVMTTRFGAQTLEGMITEQLIAEEAAKSGVVVGQADVDGKVNEIVKGLGENVNIDELLRLQGMSRPEFESQIRLQLTVEKLLTKDLTITDEDVNNYIATNRAVLVATDEAGLKEEARQAIVSQTVSEKLQEWFNQLKEKAKIVRFL